MHRFALNANEARMVGHPDMTVFEAVEAMERRHARHLLVGRMDRPLGVLTEEDVVAKVLALGLDPARVRVRDVMASGRVGRDGAFLIEDDAGPTAPLWAAETLIEREAADEEFLTEIVTGRCEECGVYSEELSDHEGLLMCQDCTGFRSALFQ